MTTAIQDFAKTHQIPMSAVALTPKFDEKKGRVTKGQAIPHKDWNKKLELKNIQTTVMGNKPTAWTMDLKQAGLFVIDIDVKNNDRAQRVMFEDVLDQLMTESKYVIQTGSGGLHFYFKTPEGAELTPQIKSDALQTWMIKPDCEAEVDLITQSIIVEGSSYEYDGETYLYENIHDSTIGDIDFPTQGIWDLVAFAMKNTATEQKVETEIQSLADSTVLREIVMGLNKKRADDRKDWISIGMICKNEDLDFQVWDQFSKQSSKYQAGECFQKWRGFHKGALTQRTLWKMLKEDNPELFTELSPKRKDYESAFSNLGHRTLAEYFINCRPDDYLYDSASGWWSIQTNKTWANSGTKFPPTLTTVISRVLEEDMNVYYADLSKRRQQANQSDDEWFAVRMKKVLDGLKQVLSNSFVKSVAEFCQGLYAEQTQLRLEIAGKTTIREMMDSNPMLFTFKDALYDFSMVDGVVVGKRPIQPTDYVTITAGYNYPVRNPVVRTRMEIVLKGIWSKQGSYGDNGETYSYVMKMLASTLCGMRNMEAFYILTGSGRNGKGLLFELLQEVMGNYYYQLPVQVLTTKIDNPRAPNPDIANLVGKRMVCSSEPEANEKLHEGTVKYMTGGDKLTGRALYGSPIEFKPQFGLFVQCNNVPNFNGITRGGVLRNCVIPFPFEFKENPQTDREKKGDPHVKNILCKSEEWRNEMFFLLLDHFEAVRGKSLDAIPMSQLVLERTQEYIAENNMIGAWWNENYEPCEGAYVLSKEAYASFKTETQSVMSDKQFKSGLEFNLIEIKKITRGALKDKMGIANWKRREPVEEDDEKQE